jgi:HSP20 family protein
MYVTTRRSPDNFNTGLRRLNSILGEAFGTWPAGESDDAITSAWMPPCDVFEDKEAVRIILEVPGVKPEDVRLSLENNMLTIRGEKKQVAEEKAERVHRYERSYGVFERSFALPSTVDADKIEARYDSGVLAVTLPKAERARPRQIEIKTS